MTCPKAKSTTPVSYLEDLCSLFLKTFNGEDFVVSSKKCIAVLT